MYSDLNKLEAAVSYLDDMFDNCVNGQLHLMIDPSENDLKDKKKVVLPLRHYNEFTTAMQKCLADMYSYIETHK